MPSGWLSGWLKQGRREKRDSTSRATGSLVSIGSTAGVRLVPTPLPTSISRQRLRSIRTASENPVVPDDDTAPQGIVSHVPARAGFSRHHPKGHDIPDKVMRTVHVRQGAQPTRAATDRENRMSAQISLRPGQATHARRIQ